MNLRFLFSAWHATWLAVSLFCWAAPVRAERLLLWGIQDGCEPNPDLNRLVERQFYQAGLEVHSMGPPGSSCAGADCAQRVRAECPQASGRVMGGRVYRNRSFLRLRLWLHELGTQKTAYQDGWCQDCQLATLLQEQARLLYEQPKWGAEPGPTPQYCTEASTPRSAGRGSLPRVHLTVYGDPKHRQAAVGLLKQHLEASLYPVQMLHRESKEYGLSDLQRIVGGSKKQGQVLGVELRKEGSFSLWLYDGLTEKTKQEEIECLGCDLERLSQVLKTNVESLLAYCFDGDCRKGAEEKLPPEACAPLPETAQCKGDAGLSAAGSAAVSTGRHIDPGTARLVKGLTWGAVAASAGTAIALGVANSFVTRERASQAFENTLTAPALTAAGISLGLIGIAVPLTLVVNRSQSERTPARAPEPPPVLRCPN